jgi:DNA (cytosine-5)-methyltransferase 1
MLEESINEIEFGLSPNGVDSFHTPNTTGLDGVSNSRKALKKRMEKLPTPCSGDYKSKPTSKSWKAKGAINFSLANPEIQAKWPTPDANCGKRGTQPNWTPKRKSGQTAQYTINQAVRDKLLPTPTAHNAKECASPSEYSRNTPTLATHAGGKLNPTWVEWLMGWPLEWTDLKPLEMDKFPYVPQQHGES